VTVLYFAVPLLVLVGLVVHTTSALWGAVRRTVADELTPSDGGTAAPEPVPGPPTIELRTFGANGQQTVRAELHLVA
jgi:hypothetical protein